MNFTDEQIIGFIFTDLRLLTELPNHCQSDETRKILADYKQNFPDLYAIAERRHAKFQQAA